MPGPLNILSLHRMGPPWRRREAVRELEYMMATYAPGHHCLVHDADLPLPDSVRRLNFHAIVLGPTFLCARYVPRLLARTLAAYEWIKTSPAVKIAMPQDDYDCCAILDRWMVDWGVDRVYTVCPEHWDVLYPRYSRAGEIRLGYTGYVPPQWLSAWAEPKPHAQRPIDVSYRASKLPANFGAIGQLKSEIGERFLRATAGSGLRVDISTDPKDLIPGRKWHEFLDSSKFCLATPSGSSLVDPEGDFRRRVARYTAARPKAPFREIAAACFPGEDGKFTFTAISPRNLEAALAGTVQIATPGSYSGLLEPMEHYVPLAEDCSNLASVLQLVRDPARVARMAADAKAAIANRPELHFTHHVRELLEFIAAAAARKQLAAAPPDIPQRMTVVAAELERAAQSYWRLRRWRYWIRDGAIRLGARHVKRLLLAATVSPPTNRCET